MIEGKHEDLIIKVSSEVLPKLHEQGEIWGYENLDNLISNGGNISSEVLSDALDIKQITKDQFSELTFKLLQRLEKEKKSLEKNFGIDELTGLLRRDFLEKLDEKITEVNFPIESRRHAPKSVMLVRIDINNFKRFNEPPFNHHIGDQALIAFSKHLQTSVGRKGLDVLFRVGGDEFAVIMPILEEHVDFEKIFFEVQSRINKDLSIQTEKGSIPITASMGYSVLKRGELKTAKDLSMEADLMERVNKTKK